MADLIERITVYPDLCNGKPTILGKRITVQTILEHLAAGDSREIILYHFPSLEDADIDACLHLLRKWLEETLLAIRQQHSMGKYLTFQFASALLLPLPALSIFDLAILKPQRFSTYYIKNWSNIAEMSKDHKLVTVYRDRIEVLS